MYFATTRKKAMWEFPWWLRIHLPGWAEGTVWEFRMDRYTLLYLKWITNRDLLYRSWNSIQCYVAAGCEGNLGKNGCMGTYG